MGVPRDSAPITSTPAGAPAITPSERDALLAGLRRHRRILLAVSGGADSMALMFLMSAWRDAIERDTPELHIVTIDHALRPEAAEEAAWVAAQARTLGLPHRTMQWSGEKPSSGLQEAARTARYRLLAEAARDQRCDVVVLAHTREDQAETLLMRLARGSGVDGLAAMRPVSSTGDLELARPLLDIPKDRLLATLREIGLSWREDPSNSNLRFERVRLREVLPILDRAGVTVAAMARSAHRLGRARDALEAWTSRCIRDIVDPHDGAGASMPVSAFGELPVEIRLRMLQRTVWAFGGDPHPPRLTQMEHALEDLDRGRPATTLGGCEILQTSDDLVVIREAGRQGLPAMPMRAGTPIVWDRRFELLLECSENGQGEALEARPLGQAGLRAILACLGDTEAGERALGLQFALPAGRSASSPLPRRAWLTLPSIWRAGLPVAVPHLRALLPPEVAAALPLQGACSLRFETAQRLWKGTVG